jgi:hypothetical protein
MVRKWQHMSLMGHNDLTLSEHLIVRQSQKYKIPKDIRIKGRSGFKKNKKQKQKNR